MDDARIHPLNDADPTGGDYVLYWMQQSQRARFNHALEYAVARADELDLPVLVAFGIMDGYPEASLRHYRFMVEGLAETAADLRDRGIGFVLRHGHPAAVARELAADAALVVCDRGYLRHQRQWREQVAGLDRAVVEVESDLVVPVETASGKREYAARTIRKKIHGHLDRFLRPVEPREVGRDGRGVEPDGLALDDVDGLLERLDVDRSVPPVHRLYPGGPKAADEALHRLVEQVLPADYDAHRNQPETDEVSYMSMFLHFGQISALEIALAVHAADCPEEDRESYLEELLVRRELAFNFAWFEPQYDRFEALPGWALETLAEHAGDPREHLYDREVLDASETHDPYWNAAMREMKHTGYMHNYMRMYWGKKILEWSPSPEVAYRTALGLNNRYFLDGRDPNSYTGVAWCFGLHDRAWKERPVYGKVRYMSAGGLERKADPEAYVAKVDDLVARATGGRG